MKKETYLYHVMLEWEETHNKTVKIAGAQGFNKRISTVDEYNQIIELIKDNYGIPKYQNVLVTSFNFIG